MPSSTLHRCIRKQLAAVIVVWWLACSTVDHRIGGSNLPCAGVLRPNHSTLKVLSVHGDRCLENGSHCHNFYVRSQVPFSAILLFSRYFVISPPLQLLNACIFSDMKLITCHKPCHPIHELAAQLMARKKQLPSPIMRSTWIGAVRTALLARTFMPVGFGR